MIPPRWRNDFAAKSKRIETWYDLDFDADLIAQSLAAQYGVLPSAQGELSFADWSQLVAGIMDNTPLGRVVSVRMEKDPKIIAGFDSSQRRLRSEWLAFRARRQKDGGEDQPAFAQLRELQNALASMFGGKGGAYG